jgi:hypothetical protein
LLQGNKSQGRAQKCLQLLQVKLWMMLLYYWNVKFHLIVQAHLAPRSWGNVILACSFGENLCFCFHPMFLLLQVTFKFDRNLVFRLDFWQSQYVKMCYFLYGGPSKPFFFPRAGFFLDDSATSQEKYLDNAVYRLWWSQIMRRCCPQSCTPKYEIDLKPAVGMTVN